MAQVLIAEAAAQKLVTVFGSTPNPGSAIDGRARPAPANAAAVSAPAPFGTRRIVRVLCAPPCVNRSTGGVSVSALRIVGDCEFVEPGEGRLSDGLNRSSFGL